MSDEGFRRFWKRQFHERRFDGRRCVPLGHSYRFCLRKKLGQNGVYSLDCEVRINWDGKRLRVLDCCWVLEIRLLTLNQNFRLAIIHFLRIIELKNLVVL